MIENKIIQTKFPLIPIMLVIMLLSLLLGTFHVAFNGIVHCTNKEVINITTSAIGMLISLILFLNIAQDNIRKPKPTFLFLLCIFTLFFVLFSDFLSWSYKPTIPLTYKYIFDSNIYIFDILFLFCYNLYLKCYLDVKYKLLNITFLISNIIFVLSLILIITNFKTQIFFFYEDGWYTRSPTFWISYIYIFYVITTNFILTIFFSKQSLHRKLAFLQITIITIIPIIFHLKKYGFAFTEFGFFISTFVIYANVQIEERVELEKKRSELLQAQTDVTLSQIQPHFIYNSLATISALCDFDPLLAQNAVDRFASYLRMNLYSIKSKDNIPFNKELEHIQTYLWLEQLRFENRLKVKYDIQFSDFEIPPLSVQPIVENAVKHGICKKPDGGTVTIISTKDDNNYLIIVKDDGIGFSLKKYQSENQHSIGMNSVKERIEQICKGSVKFESEINKGTKVTISIPIKKVSIK